MIDSFSGEYRFLSNFFDCPIYYGDILYRTVEHAYQAQKIELHPGDVGHIERREISELLPGEAKKYGRAVKMSDKYRKWFEENKIRIMKELLIAKFGQPHMSKMLLKTRNHKLIEGNTWGDTFWGMCNGKGKNHLGKLLMEVRTELREQIKGR